MHTFEQLVAFIGPQGSGKSTLANTLHDSGYGFARVSFADSLRKVAVDVAVMLHGDYSRASSTRERIAQEMVLTEFKHKHRALLQALGAWARDNISESYWLVRWQDIAQRFSYVAVDDCRYNNEYAHLKALGCKFVRLEPDPEKPTVVDGHQSERDWPHFEVDITLPWVPVNERVNMLVANKIILPTLWAREAVTP